MWVRCCDKGENHVVLGLCNYFVGENVNSSELWAGKAIEHCHQN